MLYAGLAAFGLVLLAGGAYFARKEYYASKPGPVWVPVPLRMDMPLADQEALAGKIEEKLRDDDLLRRVVTDADLRAGFGSPTEDEALEELKGRMFVKAGRMDLPQGGSVPSIHVGLNGKQREKKVLGEAATRLGKDVWLMLGIDPETGRQLNAPAGAAPGDP